MKTQNNDNIDLVTKDEDGSTIVITGRKSLFTAAAANPAFGLLHGSRLARGLLNFSKGRGEISQIRRISKDGQICNLHGGTPIEYWHP
jgi:hypothetical protein